MREVLLASVELAMDKVECRRLIEIQTKVSTVLSKAELVSYAVDSLRFNLDYSMNQNHCVHPKNSFIQPEVESDVVPPLLSSHGRR